MNSATLVETYPAWLELEIGLDNRSLALSHAERTKLFEQRIKQGLAALERASPGISTKLEAFPGRPFAYTVSLTQEEIRAIWPLPELRMLSDRSGSSSPEPKRDEHGLLPFIVTVFMHIQAEGSSELGIERISLLIRSKDEGTAMIDALEQCSSSMPAYFMDSDFRIHRRWWTAEHAHVNIMSEEDSGNFGTATILRTATCLKQHAAIWSPDENTGHVTYGSPKQRPESWKHMIV